MKVNISNRQRKIKLHLSQIEKDSLKALKSLRLQRAELSILFASRKMMSDLNLRYRGVDGTTDVLSFPMLSSQSEIPNDEDFLLGDIVIDPSRAQEQALERGLTLRQELRNLLVHGLLHLMGYDHETNSYQKKKMREKEAELLQALS